MLVFAKGFDEYADKEYRINERLKGASMKVGDNDWVIQTKAYEFKLESTTNLDLTEKLNDRLGMLLEVCVDFKFISFTVVEKGPFFDRVIIMYTCTAIHPNNEGI